MTVRFTPDEVARVPVGLRDDMQRYPLVFDNLLEYLGQPEIRESIRSLDIYFDEGLIPALSFSSNQVFANPAPEEPQALAVFANDECAYVQVRDSVLLNRIGDEFLQVFEV
jgi:hypothetical protein